MLTRPTAQLRQRMLPFVAARNAVALRDMLLSLRTAEFRAAGQVLAEGELWLALSDGEFWEFFVTLTAAHPRAFLGTMIKAATARHRRQPLDFLHPRLSQFAQTQATDIDRRKMLEAFLPLFDQPEAANQFLLLMGWQEETPSARASQLLRHATPVSYYLLFNTLREMEENKALIHRFAVELIRRGAANDYKMACFLRDYFSLDALPGTFALQMPPYTLSRLENYEGFLKMLTS